jgi:hypothetical protein
MPGKKTVKPKAEKLEKRNAPGVMLVDPKDPKEPRKP